MNHPRLIPAVPWIAAYDNDIRTSAPLVLLPGARGIGFAQENPYDRDEDGALLHPGWHPHPGGPGHPLFADVRLNRQRRAILDDLCQVCGHPAGEDDQRRTLWLLPGTIDPEHTTTAQPPVCPPCARHAVRVCPPLREAHTAVRVRDPLWVGYQADQYVIDSTGKPVIVRENILVGLGSPVLPWSLCFQAAVELTGCTKVSLDTGSTA
ncbi:hypothetical protein ACFVIM_13840 [Streptomyces sp. NPDC057638]|uniref:hypothetical protein n=1 Tax=Streptomyces sp. NPDC057638 TaxID=3346190 RepID=UPI00367EFDEC